MEPGSQGYRLKAPSECAGGSVGTQAMSLQGLVLSVSHVDFSETLMQTGNWVSVVFHACLHSFP